MNESADENTLNDSKAIAFGIFDTCVTTGILDGILKDVIIYPSPNKGDALMISGLVPSAGLSVEIVDVSGRTLMEVQPNANLAIDISELAKGTYFVVFSTEDEIASRKFIRM